MLRYAAIRLLYGAIAFMAVTMILFSLLRNQPKLPCDFLHCPEDRQRQMVFTPFGSVDPWIIGYYRYMRWLVQGEFGYTLDEEGYNSRESVTVIETIEQRLWSSLLLGGLAAPIGVSFAIGIGFIGCLKPHSPFDYVGKTLAPNALAIPVLLVAVLSILVAVGLLDWTPGYEIDGFARYLLPVSELVLFTVSALPHARSEMLRQLNSEHVKFARIQGLPEWKIVLRHCVRITAMAPPYFIVARISACVSALIVVEWLFAWPGVGRLVLLAFKAGDYFLLNGVALVIVTALIALHVIVDVALAFADPRVRFPEARKCALAATTAAP